MRIIPAIDIIGGRCVRLTRGDYHTQQVYRHDPVELAMEMEDHGINYLHLVDLDGAKANGVKNHQILKAIATKTNLKVDFGGGIKSMNDLRIAFDSGASQVTLGSMAIDQPELFYQCLDLYGRDKIILGADARNRKIATHGWIKESDLDIIEFLSVYIKSGVKYVICTDISKDGMLEGVAEELYEELLKEFPVNLIASGGVSSIQDLLLLKNIGCEAAIVGKALYEGRITLNELSKIC